MALNQKENLHSGIRLDNCFSRAECPDQSMDLFRSFRAFRWEVGSSHDEIRRGKSDKSCDNIADLLPKDPFNMDISAAVTAVTGLLEGLEKDFGLKSLGFIGADEVEDREVGNQSYAGLNFVFNSSMRCSPEFINDADRKSHKTVTDLEKGLLDGCLFLGGEIEEMGFGYEKYWISSDEADKRKICMGDHLDGDGGPPPDALQYALGYLEVKDLLSVEMVCKSLHDAVRDDSLLWRNIKISQPLSDKITDDSLVRLTNKAQGRLQSLTLLECINITNRGLRHVLESNPCLTKLSVAGCVRLSIDGILCNLRAFKCIGTPGIKHLRVGGIFGITDEQFAELKLLLGAENHMQTRTCKPRFYRAGELYLSVDDVRSIDIETCPRCLELRQVYDCPAESCQAKNHDTQSCRACIFCIARCINCGCCLNNCDYEETFCLELLCLDCRKHCTDYHDWSARISISQNHTYLHPQASYHFYLCG